MIRNIMLFFVVVIATYEVFKTQNDAIRFIKEMQNILATFEQEVEKYR